MLWCMYTYVCLFPYIPYTIFSLCLPPLSPQCIDPYINDTLSKQCSLDTDGDKIPDYRVSVLMVEIAQLL